MGRLGWPIPPLWTRRSRARRPGTNITASITQKPVNIAILPKTHRSQTRAAGRPFHTWPQPRAIGQS